MASIDDITKRELFIIKMALLYYSDNRQDFASAISQKTYRKYAGEEPTIEEVHKANAEAKEISAFAQRIIRL